MISRVNPLGAIYKDKHYEHPSHKGAHSEVAVDVSFKNVLEQEIKKDAGTETNQSSTIDRSVCNGKV
jgi:hypothetical protein